MFWSHLNNNCQKQIHFMKSCETVGTALRSRYMSKYWRHLFASSTNSCIIKKKKKRMTTLSGVESFRRNPPGPPCKPTDSRYSRSAVCIKPQCAICVSNIICVSYSEKKRHSSSNKCSSQITNTSSVMCRCVNIHFALPDPSLCHGTDGTVRVDDLKIGISNKLLFSQSHKTPYSRTKDIFVWFHYHSVVVLVSNREWSTDRFSFYALHSLPEFWVVSSSSQNSGGSCTYRW
jgi:hypothetical protein